jgi:hypothetical protein
MYKNEGMSLDNVTPLEFGLVFDPSRVWSCFGRQQYITIKLKTKVFFAMAYSYYEHLSQVV